MFESTFVFQPSPWEDRHWAQLSGLPLEDVWLPVDDEVTVFGWFVDAGPTKPVLLWCHGNAGNVSHRLENIRLLYQRGISVLIFDYRGYGRSTGTPTEVGFYQDALVCYDYLVHERHVSPERLIAFGRSLGSSVAGEVATRNACRVSQISAPVAEIARRARCSRWAHLEQPTASRAPLSPNRRESFQATPSSFVR